MTIHLMHELVEKHVESNWITYRTRGGRCGAGGGIYITWLDYKIQDVSSIGLPSGKARCGAGGGMYII